MARTILVTGLCLWLAGGVLGIGLAITGSGWLLSVLPPLALDSAALGRAVAAFSIGLLLVAAAHAVVIGALRASTRWGTSGAILLAGVLSAAFITLCVACLTAATSQPARGAELVAGAAATLVGAAAYGLAAVRLVGELRARSRV